MPIEDPNEAHEQLWKHYTRSLESFDDLNLARWLSQTLGQLSGRVWRLSHPLVGVARLLAQEANRRKLWKRGLVSLPLGYTEAPCCKAPLVPLVTRDVIEHGLLCLHCGDTAMELDDLPAKSKRLLTQWARQYADVHEVAHWEDEEKAQVDDYEEAFEQAADFAGTLLESLPETILPGLLDLFPVIIWEDHDECLDVRPEELEIY
ncbi:MAG: hypothetical protein AAFY98_04805 [Verrucomicrobiota bacterium]